MLQYYFSYTEVTANRQYFMKKLTIPVIFSNLNIRTKLLLVYAALFFITVTAGSLAVYLVAKGNIEQGVNQELENTTIAMRNMVRIAATTAIRTHLHGIASERLREVRHFHSLYKKGEFSEAEAKERAGKVLLREKIGKTGYIFVWDIRRAPVSIPLAVHPYIQDRDVADVDFVQAGAKLKNGFIEYDWKNPHEKEPRKKSMYLAYFAPWHWVIAAASYREEFLEQVNINDFRDLISPMKFGKSGYAFVIDISGTVILHPKLSGNFYDVRDADGKFFVREMCEKKNGTIIYSWKNPDDSSPRKKLTVFRYIPEYNWIVASSSYYDEFLKPLHELRNIILITALTVILFLFPLTIWLSSLITHQLTTLVKGFADGSSGNLSVRIKTDSRDEIGVLTGYFNSFMEKLETYNSSLHNEILEKDKTAEQLEIFRKFAEASGQGFFMTDMQGIITYVNPAMCSIIGYKSPDDLLGSNIFSYFESDFNDRLFSEIFPALKQYDTWMGELVIKTAQGGIIDVIQNVFLIRDNSGHSQLFATVITDITERKQSENIIHAQNERIQDQLIEMEIINQELVKTHERLVETNIDLSREKELLATTLRSIADGVITTNRDGHITLMNHTAETITGVVMDDVSGKHITTILELINEKNGEVYINPVTEALETGKISTPRGDPVLIDDKGSIKYVLATAAPIFDMDRTLAGAVLVIRDDTERHTMEKELVKSMKIESLGIFAGGLAHDFNNLLTSIMGNISLAGHLAKDDDKLSAILNDALNASLSARELTQQLLTFSRGGEPVISVESLGELLVRAIDFIMSGSGVRVLYDIPDDLWNVMIDRGQINQVVYNIALNARQAMPFSGVFSCMARNFEFSTGELPLVDGDYVKIDFADNGPGIPAEIIKNIFDPFFSTREKGSGLGLAIAYSVMHKHGGHISLESRLGAGSTFTIYIPASMENLTISPDKPIVKDFGKGRILLMDDDKAVADIAVRMLNHLGFEADWARDGAEALKLYSMADENGHPYRAVIMDLTVPGGMGGREAVGLLRENYPSAIVFVSSGYSNDPVMASYSEYGFDGVLSKPYLFEDLSEILLRHLSGNGNQIQGK